MDLAEAGALGTEPAVRHPWETSRLEFVRGLIRRHVVLGSPAVVIDIGCGDTFVVGELAGEYHEAVFYAIDTAFTDELVEGHRARLPNARIRRFASLEAVQPPIEGSASLILLMDVLEHIEDDRVFLAELAGRRFVAPDTKFLITAPAFQSLFSSHDACLGHYRRYSNRTLRTCLEQSGLTVLDSGYFFCSLLPVRLLQVLKERLPAGRSGKATSRLVAWQGGSTTTRLVTRALVADTAVSMLLKSVGLTLPGLSNYAICVKSV